MCVHRLVVTRLPTRSQPASSARSRALAFVDVGYYFRGGSNPAKDTKLGYGIGLRAYTRLGIIGLDYGLGEGDRLLDGKLHVGLVREF